jgi:hypothetical protein
VNKSVTLGHTKFICSDFARQDIAEGTEGVMECLVVDSGVEVLDEDVARAGFAERRVTLRPHDTTRAVLDQSVVEFLKRFLTYLLDIS